VPADESGLDRPEPLVYLVLTGGTERRLLASWHRRRAQVPDEPAQLIVHPLQNSLPAAMEALARLRQLGARGRILPLDGPSDGPGLATVDQAVRDLEVRSSLRQTKIGLLGDPSDWLVASMPAADAVRSRWGPQVVEIDIAAAVARYRAAEPVMAGQLAASVSGRSLGSVEPSMEDVGDAALVYPVLKRILQEEGLDAFTVRCFDLLAELRTSGCVALAQLLDDGIIAGCEGDVPSALAMLWTSRLLGVVPWMANPAWVDPAERTVLLAHCTVARSLVETYRLRSHFESGIGVGIEGTMPTGEVTLVRIGGAELDRLWVADGKALPTPHREGVCRTQQLVRLDQDRTEELLLDPLGNHIVALPGHHAPRLRAWWELMVPAG
jgi:L-fucose isomerase-like protein